MVNYVLKRTILAILIIILAIAVLFCMVFLIPGDPAAIALGPRATPEIKQAFRESMGLDKPIIVQLFRFFTNVLQGDLGVDVWSRRSVSTILLEVIPHTLGLVLLSIVWPVVIGIPMGCYAAIHRHGFLDKVIGVVSVGVIAIPSFVVAIYALLFFAVKLRWFPAIGVSDRGNILNQVYYLVLPAFAIGLGWVGYLARLVRASMLEVLGENYIRTARSFGIPESVVIFKHALKVAIVPTVALIGVGIGSLVSGAVFAEIVFSRPGIGKLIYDSVITRNYPLVMGGVIVTTSFLVTCTLVADLLNAYLDPRVREKL